MSAEEAHSFHEWCEREARAVRSLMTSQPLVVDMPESSVERAAHNVHQAIADFTVAIQEAQTTAEAWRLYNILEPLVSVMDSTRRAALKRTETINR